MAAASIDDEREFSGVDLDPEQQASNAQYFKDKGYDLTGDAAAPPAEATIPAEGAAEVPPADKPAEVQPVVATPAEEIDAETQGEFSAAKNDGEKLGRWAKKNKELRELREKTAKDATALAERDARIEELRKRVEATATPAPATTSPLAPPATPVAEAPKPEPIKAKEFEKPKPERPTIANFKDADDPYAALLEANAEYAEKLSDWKDEKRDFDTEQRTLVAKQNQEQEQVQTQTTEAQQQIDRRWQEARSAHPDYDALTKPLKYTGVLQYVLRERLKDGFEIGYLLAKPENAEVFKALTDSSMTAKDESQASVIDKIDQAIADIAIFRHNLKTKATPSPVAPAVQQPAAEVTAPVVEQPKQTPSTQEPRREEAAPVPIRGRGAIAERPEDVPLEDYDRRRELRKRTGTY